MPVGTSDGVYTLIIDKNGDADSVGSPDPYSLGGESELCFGSLDGKGKGRIRLELDCHSTADLKGSGDPYKGTVTLEPPQSISSFMDCDKGPGVLVITWDDGDQDDLCWIGDGEATPESGS
ncbi:hypothetical protein AB0I98_07480 [Streptomyces sp. NPDC050211]|uniref:hypothetical protein n=1 Tax=Streptomyces sp. NPDC050211 TaxID=3154932 RepID=UPI00342D1B26